MADVGNKLRVFWRKHREIKAWTNMRYHIVRAFYPLFTSNTRNCGLLLLSQKPLWRILTARKYMGRIIRCVSSARCPGNKGYVQYDSHQPPLCLCYAATAAEEQSAVNQCEQDGARLVRVKSMAVYTIVMAANCDQ